MTICSVPGSARHTLPSRLPRQTLRRPLVWSHKEHRPHHRPEAPPRWPAPCIPAPGTTICCLHCFEGGEPATVSLGAFYYKSLVISFQDPESPHQPLRGKVPSRKELLRRWKGSGEGGRGAGDRGRARPCGAPLPRPHGRRRPRGEAGLSRRKGAVE